MAKNIIDKIWEEHVIIQKEGHPAILGIDLQLTHEVTSPQGFSKLRDLGIEVKYPHKNIATLDHSIPTRQDRENIHDPTAKKQVETLRKNAKENNIKLYDYNSGHQGIVHVIGPELGLTQPGMTIVCGDSHTATHGAFGAMAFGVGSTEVGYVLASGCLLQTKPKTFRVEFKGSLPKGVYSKDLILKLISEIGVGGANGHFIEYTGECIRQMSMEARMTICNMSIEAGARGGLISPDQKTFDYIEGRKYAPKGKNWQESVEYWKTLASDEEASYDKEIVIEIDNLEPMITWGINPSQGISITNKVPEEKDIDLDNLKNYQKALEYTRLKSGQEIANKEIDWVFVGSCTNSRIEDLRIVAKILKGKKIHPEVTCYIVPGSETIKAQAEAEGLDLIFKEAGANWRMPGCSMCLGMNDDKVPSQERCVSTSNRNFMNRQGPGAITHLASPATAIYSAIKGKISDVREVL